MATERVLSNLNLISFKTEGGLQNHIDELQEGDLAFTPDNSLKGTLLDYKWADHLLNDMSWLRADTFSWQSGDVYVAAYKHLASEMHIENLYAWQEEESRNVYTKSATPSVGDSVYRTGGGLYGTVQSVGTDNITVNGMNFPRNSGGDILGTNAETDTVDDITITFYRAEDGHKICLPDQEDNVLELYNKTGVAWYYILDTENKQFKLPRTKYGFTGLRDEVGGYVEAGLPNITGEVGSDQGTWRYNSTTSSGALYVKNTAKQANVGSANGIATLAIDASLSSSIYGNSETVQPPATQMYLYFYVGNFERDAIEQTAGVTVETLNGKADSDLGNIPANYDYVVESQLPTAENGYTWYRKYKSGWVEQGGSLLGTDGYVTTVFPIEFTNDKYTLFCINHQNVSTAWSNRFGFDKTTTGFTWVSNSNIPVDWQASGMSA